MLYLDWSGFPIFLTSVSPCLSLQTTPSSSFLPHISYLPSPVLSVIQIHLHIIKASFCWSEAEHYPLGFHLHIYNSCKPPFGVVTSPRYSEDILLASTHDIFSPALGGFSTLNLVSSMIDLLFFIVYCLSFPNNRRTNLRCPQHRHQPPFLLPG